MVNHNLKTFYLWLYGVMDTYNPMFYIVTSLFIFHGLLYASY